MSITGVAEINRCSFNSNVPRRSVSWDDVFINLFRVRLSRGACGIREQPLVLEDSDHDH